MRNFKQLHVIAWIAVLTVIEKPPAKRPYMRLKMHKRGKLAVKPHNRNSYRVDPRVEIKTTVVTWSLSTKAPKMIPPKTDVVLSKATASVPDIEGSPSARA